MKEVKAEKVNMSQVFADDGRVTPVTLVKFEKVPEDLTPGTAVRITAISRGKGFAGVMKRWGFAGGPATHGQSDRERAPGSIGAGTTPGRVLKGKKMAGRMGTDRVTVRGLKVVEVDSEKNIVKISGAIPGPRKSAVTIRYEPGEETQKAEETKDNKVEEKPEGKEKKGG